MAHAGLTRVALRARLLWMVKTLATLLLLITIGLSCSDDKGTDDDQPVLIAVAFEDSLDAGKWVICWDQHDDTGVPARAGDYKAKIAANDFAADLSFLISEVAATLASLSCGSPSSPGLPDIYAANLTATEYALGDTINLILAIPEAANVRVEICTR